MSDDRKKISTYMQNVVSRKLIKTERSFKIEIKHNFMLYKKARYIFSVPLVVFVLKQLLTLVHDRGNVLRADEIWKVIKAKHLPSAQFVH